MADTLEQSLTRTRAGYENERKWHRFLLDAYTGGGGFAGRVACSEAELGSACGVYPASSESYLDKYPREDEDKFKRRVKVAHYINYVETLTDLKADLATSKPYTVEGLPKQIDDWRANADGKKTSFDTLRKRLVKRAAIFGWAPTLVDSPKTPENVATVAQAKAAGVAPRLVPLYPANLTEWSTVDGELRWLKIRNDFVERETFQSNEAKFALIDVWTRTEAVRFRIADGGQPVLEVKTGRNGGIPITSLRHKEAEDDPLVGLPMNGQVAVEARRLFNLISALDEALDGSCFPVLVIVDELDPNTDDPEGGSEIVVGAKNGLTLPKDSSQKHYYLAPPAEVFAALEKRIMETVREMFRMARVEFVRPAGSQNESGIARKHAFQQTNNAVESFAQQIAAWEQATYVEVGRAFGISEAELEKIRVVPPDDFDIEDIESALKQAEAALKLKLGAHFDALLKKRLAIELLPNVAEKDRKVIESEIDTQAVEDASNDAFAQSGAKHAGDPLNPDPNAADGATGGTFGGVPNRPAGPGAGAG